MITLRVADLVVIAASVLNQDPDAVLDQLDVQAAEAAMAQAIPHATAGPPDPAKAAAALLHALLRHPVLPRGGEQVALVATVQFLALNGLDLDLDPPEATAQIIADGVAGRLADTELAGWLAPRLSPRSDGIGDSASCATGPMPRWLPSWKRRGLRHDPFRRFTDRARTVVVLAQQEARRLHHNYLGTEHLLLGLLEERDGVAAKTLQTLGITAEQARRQVEEIIGRGPHAPAGHIPFTPRAKMVITECAKREAMQLGHAYIGTEHLLLGLIREGEGVAAQVLIGLGASHTETRDHVVRLLRDHPGAAPAATPAARPYLDDALDQVRHTKQAAIDADDLDTAAVLRDAEKRLLLDKHQHTTDPVADTAHLRGELERLRALLRRHGIDPDDGPPQAAHA
jgi:prophage maintenance system killer protein